MENTIEDMTYGEIYLNLLKRKLAQVKRMFFKRNRELRMLIKGDSRLDQLSSAQMEFEAGVLELEEAVSLLCKKE
jgi:hypothetical protein